MAGARSMRGGRGLRPGPAPPGPRYVGGCPGFERARRRWPWLRPRPPRGLSAVARARQKRPFRPPPPGPVWRSCPDVLGTGCRASVEVWRPLTGPASLAGREGPPLFYVPPVSLCAFGAWGCLPLHPPRCGGGGPSHARHRLSGPIVAVEAWPPGDRLPRVCLGCDLPTPSLDTARSVAGQITAQAEGQLGDGGDGWRAAAHTGPWRLLLGAVRAGAWECRPRGPGASWPHLAGSGDIKMGTGAPARPPRRNNRASRRAQAPRGGAPLVRLPVCGFAVKIPVRV